MAFIGEDLFHFQATMKESGTTFEEFIRDNYVKKWVNDNLYHAMRIRTSLVTAINNYLVDEGLINLERVEMSPVTDPLAHDVEHVPTIHYKGMPYVVTHSMIYMKFLACFNPKLKGIFVDSPNIRLEIESPQRKQRGKYLIDFSQIDVEVRRNRGIGLEEYKNKPDKVKKILKEDMEKAIDFFERMLIECVKTIVEKNDEDLKALGVALEVPKSPFPRVKHDAAIKKYGKVDLDAKVGEDVPTQFFWVTGLMRENYDLIYPYLLPDGSKLPFRMTAVFQKQEGQWRIVQLHGSLGVPNAETDSKASETKLLPDPDSKSSRRKRPANRRPSALIANSRASLSVEEPTLRSSTAIRSSESRPTKICR